MWWYFWGSFLLLLTRVFLLVHALPFLFGDVKIVPPHQNGFAAHCLQRLGIEATDSGLRRVSEMSIVSCLQSLRG